MPRKIRELIVELENAGFLNRGGKGSHRNFVHPASYQSCDDFGIVRRRRKAVSGASGPKGNQGIEIVSIAGRYLKIVEWSDEDQCFVGSCPGLLYGGCHGNDEQAVFAELCEIVSETIELYQIENRQLPPPTAGHDWASAIANASLQN